MRSAMAFGVLALAIAPAAVGLTIDWLKQSDVDRVLAGEDIDLVADGVAHREFTANVSFEVLHIERTRTIMGDMNATLHADEGHEYAVVNLLATNHGRVPVSVFAHHFTGHDASNGKYRAIWGLPGRIDAWNVKKGSAVEGDVVFEMPLHAGLVAMDWDGEMGSTHFEVPDPSDT